MLEQSTGKDTCTALNLHISVSNTLIDKLMLRKKKK